MTKTTLTVGIQYDPKLTDPEGLASAMDRLLETVLSTPGIIEEYGDPQMGEFVVAEDVESDMQRYTLRIDGPLLANQRRLLLKVLDTVFHDEPYVPAGQDDEDLLLGVMSLLDEISDQAHDRHGIDSLLAPEPGDDPGDHNRYRCECEMPGFFRSGVPGILAHLENGRLPAGAKVERCDLCRRYDSDGAALQKLKELGHVEP